jgi:hypothetical protein
MILEECRRRDIGFDKAWEIAVRSLPRGHSPEEREEAAMWRGVLRWAREEFALAYTRKTSAKYSVTEAALVKLVS